jgi:D-arabinose 1-dehydrogenase-like Zn-dependent alcohol dehydrogenase
MVAPVEALVPIPETLSDAEAAPLLCAGITTYNALRHSGALPGDLVAVQGIGGLGHLGIQFASKFGYKVAAIGRGSEKRISGYSTTVFEYTRTRSDRSTAIGRRQFEISL